MKTHQTLPSATPLTPAYRRLCTALLLAGIPLFGQQPAPPVPPPAAQKAPAGCIAAPVKPPRFHLPKKVQDAINKNAKKIADKSGVELDPNAAAQAVKDAQKPCPPPAPAPAASTPPKQ